MGEKSILRIAELLERGVPIKKINFNSFTEYSPIYLGEFYINADSENGLEEFYYFQ